MIEVRSVSKSFGPVHAVRGVSLSVRPGEVTGLLGPNGAGKTTLIRMIASYLSPTAGVIRVCGHETIVESLAARRALGYLPEAAPAYPELSVRGFLEYRAKVFGVPRAGRKPAIDAVLKACWLEDMHKRRIGTLSKGYRQRVGLAAAILHQPSVIILDEPTSGLDPAQIRGMRDLIRGLATGQTLATPTPRTVLLSSHILPEVEATCDRVLIMAAGQIRADGTPAQLMESFKSGPTCVAEVLGASADDLTTAAKSIPGVVSVQAEPCADSAIRVNVYAADRSADLREPLARALARLGPAVVVRELRKPRPTLEQVFLSVVEGSAPWADNPRAAATAAPAGAAA